MSYFGQILAGEDDEEDEEIVEIKEENTVYIEKKQNPVVQHDKQDIDHLNIKVNEMVVDQKEINENDILPWENTLKQLSVYPGSHLMSNALQRQIDLILNNALDKMKELSKNQEILIDAIYKEYLIQEKMNNDHLNEFKNLVNKIPNYITKLQTIKYKMIYIQEQVDTLKQEATRLQINAQSYAIAKEEENDSNKQWNKVKLSNVHKVESSK